MRHGPQDAKDETGLKDKCYTPAYALDPLLPFIPKHWTIWESAAGGNSIVRVLQKHGCNCVYGDIDTGQDFFKYQPDQWDCQITNPPYSESIKYPWIERSYQLGKPFALLMPADTYCVAQAAIPFEKYGIQIIAMTPRVNFIMPIKGLNGGGANFPVAWFTWGLSLPKDLIFARIKPRPDEQLSFMDLGGFVESEAEQMAFAI